YQQELDPDFDSEYLPYGLSEDADGSYGWDYQNDFANNLDPFIQDVFRDYDVANWSDNLGSLEETPEQTDAREAGNALNYTSLPDEVGRQGDIANRGDTGNLNSQASSGTHSSDPVNTLTGEFYIDTTDLSL